jgi:hypothetical protein
MLEGDLKSLNLPSLLQLISQERSTGVLKIKRKNEVVDIGFHEGLITGAFFERGDYVERLEDYLVKSGYLKQNLFEMIKEIYQETKRPIMNIILEDKYLSADDVEKVIRFKIQEVIDEIFSWQEGEFKFEASSVIYPKSILKIRMNTESLVIEAARRYDEWPKISKAISSPDLVFKKVDRPELKLHLAEDEERVLSLIDGQRNVDDMVGISGLGKFHTYSCLYRLQSTGQVEVAFAKPIPKKLRPKRDFSVKKYLTPILAIVILGVLILEYMIGNQVSKKVNVDITVLPGESEVRDYRDFQMIFFYKNNRLPSPDEVRAIFSSEVK